MLYDQKNQHVKWDTSDPWLRDSAANQWAGGGAFASTPATLTGAGFAGGVQSLSGAAASEMLDSLLGPGGAETIAAMKARVRDQAVPAADPAERLARLKALRDGGVADRCRVRGSAPEDHQRDLTPLAADKFIPSRHLIDIDILSLTKEEASMKLGQ